MSKQYDRRDALRMGFYGMAATGLSAALGRSAYAASSGSQAGIPKMLVIFLRGGNDGVNTVIPDADPDYAASRTSIAIPTADSFNLNNFARLHPALEDLRRPWLNGDLALLHRIGHPFLSLSHFTSQQHWETAYPGEVIPGFPTLPIENGYVTRLFETAASQQGLNLAGASVSKAIQRAFNTSNPAGVLSHIPEVDEYTLDQGVLNPTQLAKFRSGLGTAFATPQGGSSAALIGATGAEMLDGEGLAAAAQGYTTTVPYPVAGVSGQADQGFVNAFGQQAKDAVALLKCTECRVAGIELGGFDTHSNQGGKDGRHADRLRALGGALKAIYSDTGGSSSPNLLTIVMSEFGRTSLENGSGGTDHGKASVMFAMGRDVNGGVYNCDASTWQVGTGTLTGNPLAGTGDMYSLNNRWVDHITDFRAVLAEALEKHMGVSKVGVLGASEMNTIIPSYDVLSALYPAYPSGFADLNFL